MNGKVQYNTVYLLAHGPSYINIFTLIYKQASLRGPLQY